MVSLNTERNRGLHYKMDNDAYIISVISRVYLTFEEKNMAAKLHARIQMYNDSRPCQNWKDRLQGGR